MNCSTNTGAEIMLTHTSPQSGIPIVFAGASEPVATGLVASLARPGGNVTGLSLQQTDYAGKRFELFREVVPQLHRLAILGSVGAPGAMLEMSEVQATARALGLEVVTAVVLHLRWSCSCS